MNMRLKKSRVRVVAVTLSNNNMRWHGVGWICSWLGLAVIIHILATTPPRSERNSSFWWKKYRFVQAITIAHLNSVAHVVMRTLVTLQSACNIRGCEKNIKLSCRHLPNAIKRSVAERFLCAFVESERNIVPRAQTGYRYKIKTQTLYVYISDKTAISLTVQV